MINVLRLNRQSRRTKFFLEALVSYFRNYNFSENPFLTKNFNLTDNRAKCWKKVKKSMNSLFPQK